MFDQGRPVWIHISEESNLKHHRKGKKKKEIPISVKRSFDMP